MAAFSKFRANLQRNTAEAESDAGHAPAPTNNGDDLHEVAPAGVLVVNDDDLKVNFEELISEDAQRGVQNVEAVTLTWSRGSLVAVFIL